MAFQRAVDWGASPAQERNMPGMEASHDEEAPPNRAKAPHQAALLESHAAIDAGAQAVPPLHALPLGLGLGLGRRRLRAGAVRDAATLRRRDLVRRVLIVLLGHRVAFGALLRGRRRAERYLLGA